MLTKSLKNKWRTRPARPRSKISSALPQIIKYDDIHKRFADYLRGKRIAMVGKGAPKDIIQGDYIDSFDVVVRVHWPIPYHDGILPGVRSEDEPRIKWDPPPFVPEKWQPVLGKKTHIFYTTIAHADPKWCQSIVKTFEREGGKFICESNPGLMMKPREGRLAWTYEVRQTTHEVFMKMKTQLGSEPFGGTLAIFDICSHEVKEVYLTGFPCFISDKTPDGMTNKKPNPRTVPLNDFRWIRQLVKDNPERMKVDSYMQYVFEKY